MAFSEFEVKRHEKLIANYLAENRPPLHIRQELDINCRIENQSVTIYEIRPQWDEPSITNEIFVAKTTFVRSQNIWKIYWLRQDLKWHSYQPMPAVRLLENFFEVVEQDEHGCFWG
jgi:hypothetical protein